jgi:hypothetical protein
VHRRGDSSARYRATEMILQSAAPPSPGRPGSSGAPERNLLPATKALHRDESDWSQGSHSSGTWRRRSLPLGLPLNSEHFAGLVLELSSLPRWANDRTQ